MKKSFLTAISLIMSSTALAGTPSPIDTPHHERNFEVPYHLVIYRVPASDALNDRTVTEEENNLRDKGVSYLSTSVFQKYLYTDSIVKTSEARRKLADIAKLDDGSDLVFRDADGRILKARGIFKSSDQKDSESFHVISLFDKSDVSNSIYNDHTMVVMQDASMFPLLKDTKDFDTNNSIFQTTLDTLPTWNIDLHKDSHQASILYASDGAYIIVREFKQQYLDNKTPEDFADSDKNNPDNKRAERERNKIKKDRADGKEGQP